MRVCVYWSDSSFLVTQKCENRMAATQKWKNGEKGHLKLPKVLQMQKNKTTKEKIPALCIDV